MRINYARCRAPAVRGIASFEALILAEGRLPSHVVHLPEAADVILACQQRHADGRNRCR
jgi:antirestriction protein